MSLSPATPPSYGHLELAYLVAHGWFTAKCPCQPFPQQQRTKTYRSTSTSTELTKSTATPRISPTNMKTSSDPLSNSEGSVQPTCNPVSTVTLSIPEVQRAFLSKNDTVKYISLAENASPSRGFENNGKAERRGAFASVYFNCCKPFSFAACVNLQAPPPVRPKKPLPSSSSIDLIDLNDGQYSRYSNFNPGYKSSTPPDDDVCSVITRSGSDFTAPSLPVLKEISESAGDGFVCSFAPRAVPSMSMGHLDGSTFYGGLKKATRASWAGPSNSPSPPPQTTRLDSHDGLYRCIDSHHHHHHHHFTRCPEMSHSPSSSSNTSSPRSSRSEIVSACQTPPHSPIQMVAQVAPPTARSKLPTPPRSPHSTAWFFSNSTSAAGSSATEKKSSRNSHYYWELEFTKQPASPIPIVESSGVTPQQATSVEFCPKLHQAVVSSSSDMSSKQLLKPSVPIKSLGTVKVLSLEPKPKTNKEKMIEKCGRFEVPASSGTKPDIAVKPVGVILKSESRQMSIANAPSSPVWIAKPLPSGHQESPPTEGERPPSNRSSSCDQLCQLQAPQGEGRRAKQRCPTPPRVLSPSLDNVSCELIADI